MMKKFKLIFTTMIIMGCFFSSYQARSSFESPMTHVLKIKLDGPASKSLWIAGTASKTITEGLY
jgi:hypothetical protein